MTLQAAMLPLASNTALVPASSVVGTATTAIGFRAAFTALSAFTIPAPHWPGTHEHSPGLVPPDGTTTGHTGSKFPVFAGNGVALDSMREIICGGVKFALTARMS